MPVAFSKAVTFGCLGWPTAHDSIDKSIIPEIFEESAKQRLNHTKS